MRQSRHLAHARENAITRHAHTKSYQGLKLSCILRTGALRIRRIAEMHAMTNLYTLVKSLRDGFARLPDIPPGQLAAENRWNANRKRLRHLVGHDNPALFLNWDVIRQTMFCHCPQMADYALNFLTKLPDWQTRWSPAMREDLIGYPVLQPHMPTTSDAIIQQALFLALWEKQSGRRVDSLSSILEFGGGYGSLARFAYRMGFRGRYYIYDLPEFCLLQQFFLAALEIPNVTCINDLASIPANLSPELFIAMWSLSETPLELRNRFMPLLVATRLHILSFQDHFDGNQNLPYFANWTQARKDVRWTKFIIPWLQDNTMLIGVPFEPHMGTAAPFAATSTSS
jgi:hypothetical protein